MHSSVRLSSSFKTRKASCTRLSQPTDDGIRWIFQEKPTFYSNEITRSCIFQLPRSIYELCFFSFLPSTMQIHQIHAVPVQKRHSPLRQSNYQDTKDTDAHATALNQQTEDKEKPQVPAARESRKLLLSLPIALDRASHAKYRTSRVLP